MYLSIQVGILESSVSMLYSTMEAYQALRNNPRGDDQAKVNGFIESFGGNKQWETSSALFYPSHRRRHQPGADHRRHLDAVQKAWPGVTSPPS